MINSKGFEENLYYSKKGHIRTFSGYYIDILNPSPETIDIVDIAHALAEIPRFMGHLANSFSVLNHINSCVEVASCMKGADIFEVLMHDCSEAYLGDIASPIKELLPDYKKIEHNLMIIISNKFNFNYPISYITKQIDKNQLEYEWDNYMILKRNPPKEDKKLSINKFLNTFKRFRP